MRVSYIICMDRGRKSLVDTLYTVDITRYVKTYLLGRAQEVKLALFSIISGQRSTELR